MNIVEMAIYTEDKEQPNPTKENWIVNLEGGVQLVGVIENLYNGHFRVKTAPDVFFDASKVVSLSRA